MVLRICIQIDKYRSVPYTVNIFNSTFSYDYYIKVQRNIKAMIGLRMYNWQYSVSHKVMIKRNTTVNKTEQAVQSQRLPNLCQSIYWRTDFIISTVQFIFQSEH